MPTNFTGPGSTVTESSNNLLNVDENISIPDTTLDTSKLVDTTVDETTVDTLSGAGSTVINDEPINKIDTTVVDPIITDEQQAEFDRQQAEADQKIIDKKAKKEEVIVDTPVVKEEPIIEDTPAVKDEAVVVEVQPEEIKNIAKFKEAGGDLDSLSSLISNVYGGMAEIQGNKVVGEINGEAYEWIIDDAGNPIRTKIEGKVEMGKEDFINTLSGMIAGGSSNKDIGAFITENKDLYNANKSEFIAKYKADGINMDTLKRNQSIAKMNGTELDKAIKNGTINVLDLSPEAKARYDSYLNVNRNNDIANAEDVNELVYELNSKTETFDETTKTYTDGLRGINKEISELYNTGEIQTSREGMNTSYAELTAKKREYDEAEDKIRAENKGVPSHLVNARVAKVKRTLQGEINGLIDEYNVELSNYQVLEGVADKEAEILQFDMSINEIEYNSKLEEYQFNRDEMSDTNKLELIEESNIRAEDRSNTFNLQLLENERAYAKDNKTGVYETDRDGTLLYVTDGVAEVVKTSDGKVIGTVIEDGYTDTVNELEDGGYEILRTYDTGNVDYFTRGVSGTDIMNTNLGASNVLSSIPDGDYQCGEFTDIYIANGGLVSTTTGKTVDVSDSYESKKDYINSQEPQIGGLAVWNPVPEGKYGENGHIGIVTGYDPATGKTQITDSNSKGDEKKRTYTIDKNEIINSDGGFVHVTKPGAEDTESLSFDKTSIPQFSNYLTKGKIGTSEAELKTIISQFGSVSEFKKQAEIYNNSENGPRQKELEKIVTIKDKVEGLLSDNNSGSLSNSVGTTQFTVLPGTEREKENFLGEVQNLLDGLTLQKLIDVKSEGATFGALSNEELRMLQNTASSLNQIAIRDDENDTNRITGFKGSEKNFKEKVQAMADTYNELINSKEDIIGNETSGDTDIGLDDINIRLNEIETVDPSNSLDY